MAHYPTASNCLKCWTNTAATTIVLIERILIQSFSEFLIRNSEFLHTSAVWKYVGGGGRGLGAGGVAGVAGGGPEHGRHRRLQVHQPEVEVALRTSRDLSEPRHSSRLIQRP